MKAARGADAERLASKIKPMLATSGEMPMDGGWGYEIKWDGVRALTFVDRDGTRIVSRNGNDLTSSFPELSHIHEIDALGAALPLLLDGEIVAFSELELPNFGVLQGRLGRRAGSSAIAGYSPAHLAVFDAPMIAGRLTMQLTYMERRSLLERFDFAADEVSLTQSFDDGELLLEQMLDRGMEGILAKRTDSEYKPGRRSNDWVKIKRKPRQEFVVGGWTPGAGARTGGFGALALGVQNGEGLRYVGNVGSGFSSQSLAQLSAELGELQRDTNPFTGPVQPADMRFVKPQLVVEVEYQELTADGRLRQPVYKGLRTDKSPNDVVLERNDGEG